MRGTFIVFLGVLALVSGSGCAMLNLGVTQAITPPATNTLPPALAATTTPTPKVSLAVPTATQAAPTEIPTTPPATPAAARPEPTQPGQQVTVPGPINTLPPSSPGPESLDLTSPGLYRNPLSDYTARFDDQIDGTAQDGSPTTFATHYMVRIQTQPAPAWAASNSMFDDSTRVDTVSLAGTLFTATADGQCITGAPGEPPSSPVAALGEALTGQAQRTAENVEINGLMTDQYAITAENLVPGGKFTLVQATSNGDSSSSSTLTVKLHGTGNLYLAQQGGFVVRLELSDETKAREEDFFFQPGSNMSSQTVVELIPTLPEDDPISYPAGCGGETSADDNPTPAVGSPGEITSLPLPADVQIVTESEGNLVFQSYEPTDQLEEFYKSHMTALGYTLDSSSKVGPIVNLIFSKDGHQVTITMLPTGDTVTVTVTRS